MGIILILLFAPKICTANPIAFPSWTPERSNLSLALGVNSITDLIVVIAAMAIMGEWSDADKLNFTCFMILMIIGGFIIDFVSIGISNVLVFALPATFGVIFFRVIHNAAVLQLPPQRPPFRTARLKKANTRRSNRNMHQPRLLLFFHTTRRFLNPTQLKTPA